RGALRFGGILPLPRPVPTLVDSRSVIVMRRKDRMTPHLPKGLQEFVYEREAQAYLRSLPPEHFMEATDQGTQRAITLASLALVRARRRDVHVFNELL